MSTEPEQPQVQVTRSDNQGIGKYIIIGVAVVLLLIFIFQNNFRVTFSFLFFDFTLPAWVMLVITLVAGFLIGLLTSTLLRRRRRQERRDRAR
jgi:uncharacterized integral membrane protein